MYIFSKTVLSVIFAFLTGIFYGQSIDEDIQINENIKNTLMMHKEIVSIPNLPNNKDLMLQNINWVSHQYTDLGFNTSLLRTSTLPILIAEKIINPRYKTVLFYFHIDGQPINPDAWDQEDPFEPVLKQQDQNGE